MDVILLQDVEKVGLRGEVVGVARGYARNFLLPRRLAEVATEAKVAELERRERKRLRHEAATVDQAQEIAERLRATELRFDVAAGPTGTLFGSVTSTDIADALWNEKKVRVDRRKIDLHEPIKRIGRYDVTIELFADVVVEVRTLVVPEGGELPPEEPELPEGEAVADADAAPEADAEAVAVPESETPTESEQVDPEPMALADPAPAEPNAEPSAGDDEPEAAADEPSAVPNP
jgi:large subunit ribosomal protein L9